MSCTLICMLDLYGELGRYPRENIIKTRMIKYGKQNKISRICHEFVLKSNINFKWKIAVKISWILFM